DDRLLRACTENVNALVDRDPAGEGAGTDRDRVAVGRGVDRRLDLLEASRLPADAQRGGGSRTRSDAEQDGGDRRNDSVSADDHGSSPLAFVPTQTVSMTRSAGMPASSPARFTSARDAESKRQSTSSSPGR